MLVLAVAFTCGGMAAFAFLGGQLAQTAVNRSVACRQSYDQWVASNYPTPYVDPCTGMSLSRVPTFAPMTFPTFGPLFTP